MYALIAVLCIAGISEDMARCKSFKRDADDTIRTQAIERYANLADLQLSTKWYSRGEKEYVYAKCLDYKYHEGTLWLHLERADGKKIAVQASKLSEAQEASVVSVIKKTKAFLRSVDKTVARRPARENLPAAWFHWSNGNVVFRRPARENLPAAWFHWSNGNVVFR